MITALVILAFGAPMAAAVGPQVLVAHRGFGSTAQAKYGVAENTIPAWQKAISIAETDFIIDVDAQVTGDNKFAVMHDATLERTTNGTGRVDQRTLSYITSRASEIKGVDRDNNDNDDNLPYGPPSLNAAIKFLRPQTVNGTPVKVTIEMKGSRWNRGEVADLKRLLQDNSMFTSRVNIHSFNNTYAKWAKEAGFPNVGYVAPSGGPLPSVAAIKALGSNVFVKHTLITKTKLREYNANNIRVWIWTVNDTDDLNRLLAWEEPWYALVTDDLGQMQDRLAEAA